MTSDHASGSPPFWQRKRLDEMTAEEWDSLCDGCGRCCLSKITTFDTVDLYTLDVACRLLDTATCRCSDFANRLSRDVRCLQLTAANVPALGWLPSSCAYRSLHEGRDLEWWHPLVSGSTETVRQAGISAIGRVIPHNKQGLTEYHTVDWPAQPVSKEPRFRWRGAMFGGVNASVPTFFDDNGRIDLDLIAAQCLWLFTGGCHGLGILDRAGEVASLKIDERIAVLEGLVERGVPASKILAGIGPASVEDSVRIAAVAERLGIRGVLLASPVSGRIMPADVIPDPMRDLLRRIPAALHVYMSLGVSPHAVPACLTALEAFAAESPGRLTGIRDETAGCSLGMAAVDRFRDTRFEVYTADEMMLAGLVGQGGSGLISPGANLLGRACRTVVDGAAQPQHQTIEAVSRMLRSRPGLPAIKALLARHFAEPARERVRPPLRPLDPADRLALFRSFDATGIRLPPPVER
jgi:uncharacterized cysteine cluster protein YcgN (CxxCxxCC family)/dihydrodipicolinate synthase/N-acetylneuraminate lyase